MYRITHIFRNKTNDSDIYVYDCHTLSEAKEKLKNMVLDIDSWTYFKCRFKINNIKKE